VLHSPIVFGLLAHSHSWKSVSSRPENNILARLTHADASEEVAHPRLQIDLLCVADLGTWSNSKFTYFKPVKLPSGEVETPFGSDPVAVTAFAGHTLKSENQTETFTPIGALVSLLSRRLAWENQEMRNLADYYSTVRIEGSGSGTARGWPVSIYGEEICAALENGRHMMGDPTRTFWSEWRPIF
jgi:hypothetical protein